MDGKKRIATVSCTPAQLPSRAPVSEKVGIPAGFLKLRQVQLRSEDGGYPDPEQRTAGRD